MISLDAMSMTTEGATEEQVKRNREKRKVREREITSWEGLTWSLDSWSQWRDYENDELFQELINGIETLLNQNDASLRRLEELERKEAEGEKAK